MINLKQWIEATILNSKNTRVDTKGSSFQMRRGCSSALPAPWPLSGWADRTAVVLTDAPARLVLSLTLCVSIFLLANCTQRNSKNESLNRLANASSPYLQQHADNPVDWYEWGNEALETAKRKNKPLLISIGYSSCHWCHVMEEETFMDKEVAAFMNENFVSIKIDREERPDVDQIYMNAAQLISGSGGWPLNAFALPGGKPFFAATYFPKDQWMKLLHQISEAFQNDYHNLSKQAEALTRGIQSYEVITLPADNRVTYTPEMYQEIFNQWQTYFDYASGGLIGSPKFPMPSNWEFLLQFHYLTENKQAMEAVNTTLNEMAKGGIFDHLGGGFCRYSTDAEWKIPHFEKMLYDNGQLVSLYAHAYQVTGNALYKEVIHKTLEFVRREMTSAEGGFYSSINADSEGEEGKFYVWTRAEIKKNLKNEMADLFIEYYQITDSGNWENGKNILYNKFKDDEFAARHTMRAHLWTGMRTKAEDILIQLRSKRVRPSTDDKILTSWNALMLTGYLDAYFATGNEAYFQAALTNAKFLEAKMIRKDAGLWRNYKNGKATIEAFLDDYALLAQAFIHLYQATFDVHWLRQARGLTDYAVQHFFDQQSGMFFYTSNKTNQLVARKMELTDNAIPASNAVLAEVLYFLGEYYDEDSFKEMSKSMLNQIANDFSSGPYYASWASVMGLIAYQPYEIAIMGDQATEKSRQLQQHYIPVAIFMGGHEENLPLLENKFVEGKTIIYVCRDKVCKLPVQDVDKALQQLKFLP